MHIAVLPALHDNYIYLICHGQEAVVVDPGEADAVLEALDASPPLALRGIVITHNCYDHTDGVAELRRRYPSVPIHAPAGCEFAAANYHSYAHGDTLSLFNGELILRAIATPGHTLEHLCWYAAPVLFSGDALFLSGCGRVKGGGSMAQMYESLQTLSALPDATRVYCGHEYTLANLKFAMAVEPDNADIARRYRRVQECLQHGQATPPGHLAADRQTNPFLRTHEPAVRAAAEQYAGTTLATPAAVFAALRHWKNIF